MKKIILCVFAMFFATLCIARENTKKEIIKVDFYGVDFSAVNVVGADESEGKLMDAFAGINRLFVSEPNKFDVEKFLKYPVLSLDIEHAINQIDKLKSVNFKDKKDSQISLREIIESYPIKKGNILLIVAKELNKKDSKGYFTAIVFDGETKEIISERDFKGGAKGFGLRNYWAGSLYQGLKSIKKVSFNNY